MFISYFFSYYDLFRLTFAACPGNVFRSVKHTMCVCAVQYTVYVTWVHIYTQGQSLNVLYVCEVRCVRIYIRTHYVRANVGVCKIMA